MVRWHPRTRPRNGPTTVSRTYSKRTDIRAEVRRRAGNRCEICSVEFTAPADQTQPAAPSLHHRHRRSHGGRDSVSNLLRLCRTCHTFRVHADEETSTDNGWLVPSADTEDHPVLTRHGWVYLRDDGSMEPVPWWRLDLCAALASVVTSGYVDACEEGEDVA